MCAGEDGMSAVDEHFEFRFHYGSLRRNDSLTKITVNSIFIRILISRCSVPRAGVTRTDLCRNSRKYIPKLTIVNVYLHHDNSGFFVIDIYLLNTISNAFSFVFFFLNFIAEWSREALPIVIPMRNAINEGKRGDFLPVRPVKRTVL